MQFCGIKVKENLNNDEILVKIDRIICSLCY